MGRINTQTTARVEIEVDDNWMRWTKWAASVEDTTYYISYSVSTNASQETADRLATDAVRRLRDRLNEWLDGAE